MFLDDDVLSRLDIENELAVPTHRPLRLAVYSHDAEGLGHLRRNLVISSALQSEDQQASVLLITGLRESSLYELPPGVDRVSLPALGKLSDGSYHARSLRVEMEELTRLRDSVIRAAIESYSPDVLIVDKLPMGIFGELCSALDWMRDRRDVRVILGLRDILDEPETVRREWARDCCVDAIHKYYDRVWVYGDRGVYDVAAEYCLPDSVSQRIEYAGYLNPRHVREARSGAGPASATLESAMDVPFRDVTLCVIGGGRDGMPLAHAFLHAQLPEGGGGILVTGPLMDSEDRALLHTLAAGRNDMQVVEFVTDPKPLMCCADRVISMGGYNTVCEILAFQKPALIVPRVRPRREQLIRAERLGALGLLDMLHPDQLSADSLSAWMKSGRRPGRPAEASLDFSGATRLPRMLAEAISGPRAITPASLVQVKSGSVAGYV